MNSFKLETLRVGGESDPAALVDYISVFIENPGSKKEDPAPVFNANIIIVFSGDTLQVVPQKETFIDLELSPVKEFTCRRTVLLSASVLDVFAPGAFNNGEPAPRN